MVSSPQHQYLKSLVSQCGVDELPYDPDLRELIEQHLLALIQDFPSLLILPAPFFDDDGTSLQLLQAEGTIPITFRAYTYNIPITMWLLGSYPFASPRVFVSPTPDMMIKPHHEHVNRSGQVSSPYLDKWVYPDSNLADLAHSLSSIFSLDPPLFTQTASLAHAIDGLSLASPVNDPRMRSSSSSISQSSPTSSSSSSSSPMTRRPQHVDPSEVFRQNAIKSLSERLKLGLVEHQRVCDADMKQLAATESQLKTRRGQFMLAVDSQQREREALEEKLQIICTNIDLVETWLTKHSSLQAAEINIDDVFVPCDALSKQMLDSSSADLALEDVLYSLDKAAQQGCISMDAYLKHVRAVAREQFFHRASFMKIQAMQRQRKLWAISCAVHTAAKVFRICYLQLPCY